MTAPANWQLEFRNLQVLEDQEGGDEPYFVFFGFRSTPGVPGSTTVFWTGYLDDEWAEGVTDTDDENERGLPRQMGTLAFPDVTPAVLGAVPELVGWVGVAFESDATPFGRIRDLMEDVEFRIAGRLRTLVEPYPFDPADPGGSLPPVVAELTAALDVDVVETVGDWLSSLGDPDDLIGVRVGALVAGDASLDAVVDAPFLRQGWLDVTFTGDGASYRVTGSAEVAAGPGHRMPATVEEADADLNRRRAGLLHTWGLQFRRGRCGVMPAWDRKGAGTALRYAAAGLAVLSDSTGSFDREAWSLFSGRTDDVAVEEHRISFRATVDTLAAGIVPFEEPGTDKIPGKDGGDYDFLLRDLVTLVLLFADRPDVLSTDAIRSILCQGEVTFPDDGPPVGHVPYSGQDPDEWLAAGPGGRHYFRLRLPEDGVRLAAAKGSIAETENHVLLHWSWRYLVNEYLTWVADLPVGHDRYDGKLKALVDADPGRYRNTAATRDWVLQLLGRVPHSGAFESNARPYGSITILALLTFAEAGRLFPADPERVTVADAARTALDYLAAEFAFQSFEGKRLAPIRRNFTNRANSGFYASDYLPHIFGVLTGAYVYSDSIGADISRESVCPGPQPEDPCHPDAPPCDLASAAPLDDPAWAGPYYWFRADQEAGFALWAVLSGYRVDPAVHDFMLNKHGGYFTRTNTRYSRSSYPLERSHFSVVVGPAGEPDDPAFARPRYFQEVADGSVPPADHDLPGRGPFRPVSQNYFAAPTYLNSAGGRHVNHYDITASDVIPEVPGPFPDPLGPLREWLDSLLEDSKGLQSYTVYSRPNALVPRGNLQVRQGEDTDALERLLPTMRGRDDFHVSQNLATYKSFSLGYTFHPDDEGRHRDWPQRYPRSWDAHRAGRFDIGRGRFVLFDFTAVPDHPLAGHYWVMGQVSKDTNRDQFRDYGRGFWEVVPGHRFATVTDLAAHIQATNPGGHYSDDDEDHYRYRLASSGELIEFHNRFGSSATEKSILAITDADGEPVPLDRYTFDVENADSLRGTPLLDVWQVDRDYRFTGFKYAHADGRGRATVYNPFLGRALVLDSSDYRTPLRAELGPADTVALPALPGAADQETGLSALLLDGDELYATHYAVPEHWQAATVPGELVTLDRRTLEIRRRATVGRMPHAVARHEATQRLFVVNYGDSSVSVVDPATSTVVATLTEPGWGLYGVAVSQRWGRVYVPQHGQHRVLVYDAVSLELIGTMAGLPQAGSGVVDDPADRLYLQVVNAADTAKQDLVEYAIGPDGQTELRRVTVDAQVSRPSALAVDAERCYLLTRVPAPPGIPPGQKLVVLDRRTFGVLGTVPLPDSGVGVAASASQRVVHVATDTSVLTIDTGSLAVLRTVPLGYDPKRAVVTDERTGATHYGPGGSTLTRLGAPLDQLGG